MHLAKIHKIERRKRNQNRLNMMGLRQPPGTHPNEYRPPAAPAWKPGPMIQPWFDFSGFLRHMFKAPWKRQAKDEVLKEP